MCLVVAKSYIQPALIVSKITTKAQWFGAVVIVFSTKLTESVKRKVIWWSIIIIYNFQLSNVIPNISK